MSFKIAYNLVSVLGIKVTLDENIYHVGEIMGDQQQRIEFQIKHNKCKKR